MVLYSKEECVLSLLIVTHLKEVASRPGEDLEDIEDWDFQALKRRGVYVGDERGRASPLPPCSRAVAVDDREVKQYSFSCLTI